MLEPHMCWQVLTYLTKNDVQANWNETEEEVENRVQAALVYEIEDANIVITQQHMTDVEHLKPEDYLGSKQVDTVKLAKGLHFECSRQLSCMKNLTFSKLYASPWKACEITEWMKQNCKMKILNLLGEYRLQSQKIIQACKFVFAVAEDLSDVLMNQFCSNIINEVVVSMVAPNHSNELVLQHVWG